MPLLPVPPENPWIPAAPWVANPTLVDLAHQCFPLGAGSLRPRSPAAPRTSFLYEFAGRDTFLEISCLDGLCVRSVQGPAAWCRYIVFQAHLPARQVCGVFYLDRDDLPGGSRFNEWLTAYTEKSYSGLIAP